MFALKGHCVEIQTQNFNVNNINKVIIQTQNYVLFPITE